MQHPVVSQRLTEIRLPADVDVRHDICFRPSSPMSVLQIDVRIIANNNAEVRAAGHPIERYLYETYGRLHRHAIPHTEGYT